ncbi:MAG: hypothetical protein M4579_006050 [Chaenotheca gracillima]|nr:MAG: hypothetical protein M4579_006050 [Chaenotheca gracillima]
MSRSTDPGHFFQTQAYLDDSSRKATKAGNDKGKPIKLPGKILDVVGDPSDDAYVYVAESAGTGRRVKLDVLFEQDGATQTLYRGAVAPLTSICPIGNNVYAGCWDNKVWQWDRKTGAKRATLNGHSDFVKAVCFIQVGGKNLLVSGGADAVIAVWDLETGKKLHTLKTDSRGVLGFAVDPIDSTSEAAIVFSAGSNRDIRIWSIGLTHAAEVQDKPSILAHETSVYKLRFDADGDLWTASADNTAKCLTRERGWAEDMVLQHPDFVKDIVVDEIGGKVITACRDEEVRVWDRGTGALYHTFSGHYEEVTGLAILGRTLVSVSIDCTIRQWSLKPDELIKAKEAALEEQQNGALKEQDKKDKPSLLTQEEEDELAELMDDSE